jgi:hypothetical protein
MKKNLLFVTVVCLFLASCNLPGPAASPDAAPDLLETSVAATLAALSSPAVQQPLATPTLQVQAPPPTLTSSPTLGATQTPEPGFGSIAGSILNYPYGSIPRITIVAFEQEAPYHYWYWITAEGSTFYSMDGYISSGKYRVVAYDPAGHKGGCTALIEVRKNETATCDITDWAGSYPDKPAGVP